MAVLRNHDFFGISTLFESYENKLFYQADSKCFIIFISKKKFIDTLKNF